MSMVFGPLLVAAVLGASLVLTRTMRDFAQRKRLLDQPNGRSSHQTPTPRLGGVGLMVPFLVASAGVAVGQSAKELTIVLAATLAIVVLGLVEDLRRLPVWFRMAVQLLAAAVVVLPRGRELLPALAPFDDVLPYPVLAACAILWIGWVTNLYNFMDGIDGLAGGQALWASLGLGAASFALGEPLLGWILFLLAASSAGFLRYNLPRASIFMGDVGSTAIGFFLASVPFAGRAQPVPVAAVALALSLFVLDATTTLVRRLLRGENVSKPHRTHLYQRPVVLGVPHALVTYTAYAGMIAVALLASLYPLASPATRAGMIAVSTALFGVAWFAVRRLERKAEAPPTQAPRRAAAP